MSDEPQRMPSEGRFLETPNPAKLAHHMRVWHGWAEDYIAQYPPAERDHVREHEELRRVENRYGRTHHHA